MLIIFTIFKKKELAILGLKCDQTEVRKQNKITLSLFFYL
jgi:hypothetical protein